MIKKINKIYKEKGEVRGQPPIESSLSLLRSLSRIFMVLAIRPFDRSSEFIFAIKVPPIYKEVSTLE